MNLKTFRSLIISYYFLFSIFYGECAAQFRYRVSERNCNVFYFLPMASLSNHVFLKSARLAMYSQDLSHTKRHNCKICSRVLKLDYFPWSNSAYSIFYIFSHFFFSLVFAAYRVPCHANSFPTPVNVKVCAVYKDGSYVSNVT